jgi:predicted  nucleic acid-binding Zn-ribbon protein
VDIEDLQSRLRKLENDILGLRGEMEKYHKNTDKKIDGLSNDIAEMKT